MKPRRIYRPGASRPLGAILVGLMFLGLGPGNGAAGGPAPEEEAYWWQDEIRAAAWAASRARGLPAAQWPRMAAPAGGGTLPLPPACGPITPDGRLDEPAWEGATVFFAGPLFAPWREGPFLLRARALRARDTLWLAIEAPRSLEGLEGRGPPGGLFRAGRPFAVSESGEIPGGTAGSGGRVLEVALPLPEDGITLELPCELLRREAGKLPAEFQALGLAAHQGPLWLEPFRVRLLAADVAARIEWSERTPAASPAGSLQAALFVPESASEIERRDLPLEEHPGGVAPYAWEGSAGGTRFHLEGFVYREPAAEVVAAAREILGRAAAGPAGGPESRGLLAGLESLAVRLSGAAPGDRAERRRVFVEARALRARALLSLLDAPLLFVKRYPYFAGHIYDDFYTWHPGGGIYLLENPRAPWAERRVRPVIDPGTPETLGLAVYRDPELSWDGRRVLFAAKREASGGTALYEIGLDGRGLRRLTQDDGHHHVMPCYLADGGIAFTSTRPRALVPCFNSGVATLHTIRGDGSALTSISANNVNEFDPALLPDGRILYGRWEYVDKTALYMQSLWTVHPDGSMETALFANNLARPTAVLDARPVPGTRLVVASLTPHNGQAVGAIALIDPAAGKNAPQAITNLTPEYPWAMDQGLTTGPCDPWPLAAGAVLISNNRFGAHGVIELLDRWGNRELVHCDREISLYAPMLVRPREQPAALPPLARDAQSGRFLVLDVHEGLEGVARGAVKRLRVIEETARTSDVPPGGRWWNQAFLVSWQGAYSVKNVLGTVPVEEDGSAYFEAPPGRALYLEALDERGLEVQRMRTFVQAQPGVTRVCIGCHERKETAPFRASSAPLALARPPSRLEPESWGDGLIDYPSRVQPVLDRHCVRCHGGGEGIAAGIDLSGGWTWAFNLSYETLLKHNLVGFLRCHNSDVETSWILPPRTLGSGAAPLAALLLSGHGGRLPEMSTAERDLLLAWMDTNSNYYSTWDYTPAATCDAVLRLRAPLARAMRAAGCTACHQDGHIGNDWVNLERPEWSRILRAPLAQAPGGLGLAWCRERRARTGLGLVDQSLLPPDVFHREAVLPPDRSGTPRATFPSTADEGYRAFLALIRRARAEALAEPRSDMPGAEITPAVYRRLEPPPVPAGPPELAAALGPGGTVELEWPARAALVGLEFEIHRGAACDFEPAAETVLAVTTAFRFSDRAPPAGPCHYALVPRAGSLRSAPARASLEVPAPVPPPVPEGLVAAGGPGEVEIHWEPIAAVGIRYALERAPAASGPFTPLGSEPLILPSFRDTDLVPGVTHAYRVRAIDRRGLESAPSAPVLEAALPEIAEPVFTVRFDGGARGALREGPVLEGKMQGGARAEGGLLDLTGEGHVTFEHAGAFDLCPKLSVECWVELMEPGEMPVLLSCGRWQGTGWFLQRLGGGWRWHVGGADADGGEAAVGRWVHLVGTFDGRRARLFADGREVASRECAPDCAPWPGPLFAGQYGAAPGPAYQVKGRLAAVRIYRRAVAAAEAAARAERGPPGAAEARGSGRPGAPVASASGPGGEGGPRGER